MSEDSRQDQDSTPTLGPYQIISEIGRGGMGVVYKAFHPQLMRTVALQVFLVVVAGCGKPSVEGLVQDLGDLENSRRARQELVQIGRPAVPALIQALGNEKTRFNAVVALGEIGDRRAVGPLIEMLKDENYLVRSVAAKALGEIGDERAIPPLIEGLRADEDLRMAAAKALGEIPDERAVGPLVQLLNDKSHLVRRAATKSLGLIGDKKATGALKRVFKADKDLEVRIWAAFSLTRIAGDISTFTFLTDAVSGGSTTHPEAARALGMIGDPRAVGPLIQALKDPACAVRGVSAWALGEIGDRTAIKPLIDMLTDQCIGQSSAEALKKITGQDLGVDENAWRAWYGKVERPGREEGK